jgi:phosphoribosylformylglycinamidine synthase
MTPYRVSIHITPRRGILDPQGKAVENALHSLGFPGVSSVRVGRHIVVDTDEESEEAAVASVTAMCERLLANPVIEDYEIESASTA